MDDYYYVAMVFLCVPLLIICGLVFFIASGKKDDDIDEKDYRKLTEDDLDNLVTGLRTMEAVIGLSKTEIEMLETAAGYIEYKIGEIND